ncbi:hypothetical protein PJL18_03693 [Paenarthrobacter nicotinovorans]|nr:hypothetical protein [Paenarthrobacter nicotinovorans]
MLAGRAVAELSEQGEQNHGEDGEDEVEREACPEERTLRDGEAVLHCDVVNQDAGHGQRGESTRVGAVDDEGAHQDGVDA